MKNKIKNAKTFYRASSYASAVLGVVILSARLFVCLSVRHTRALWQSQQCTADIMILLKTAITLLFWHQQWWRAMPLRSEICAQSDPPPSKHAKFDRIPLTFQPQEIAKIVQLWRIGNGPTSYRWSAYVTLSLSLPIVARKAIFVLFKNKMQL